MMTEAAQLHPVQQACGPLNHSIYVLASWLPYILTHNAIRTACNKIVHCSGYADSLLNRLLEAGSAASRYGCWYGMLPRTQHNGCWQVCYLLMNHTHDIPNTLCYQNIHQQKSNSICPL